jgi:hypothetical protein
VEPQIVRSEEHHFAQPVALLMLFREAITALILQ